MKLRVGAPLALAFVLFSTVAFAQGTTIQIDSLVDFVVAVLTPLAGVVAAAIVGWLAELLRRKFNLDIEQKHRDALQTALTNAAGLALASGKNLAAGKDIDVKNPAIAAAANYVIVAVPDALKYFGLTPESIAEKVAAKIGAMNAGA